MDTREIGQQAEQDACDFLEKNGLKLLARNYRCALGEVDLIMRDEQNTVVFIEVRKRSHHQFASAIESVTQSKQRKVIKTATHYLQKQNWFDKVACRFDIVGMSKDEIEWIKDAFSSDDF
ncbi:MAG: YraN family protein [Gammaproteobacteria bacterium]